MRRSVGGSLLMTTPDFYKRGIRCLGGEYPSEARLVGALLHFQNPRLLLSYEVKLRRATEPSSNSEEKK